VRPKSASQPNIILISLDCVRQDRLSCYGNHDTRTPNIDAIATEGVRFTQAICQAPFTTSSLASILTGLYPFNHNIRLLVGQYLAQNIPTLGSLFKQAGYVTGGFPSVFLLDRNSGFKNGFDVFDDRIETIRDGFRGPWRPGDLTTDALLRFIETYKKKPFAAWVHYFDPHDYNPGNPDSLLMQNRKIEETDGLIAKLIKSLKKWRLWEKTLVVITADHGDSFGEHGEYGHGKALYDTTLRVPLIFRWPQQLAQGISIEQQVRLIDILPTILDLIGCLKTVQSQNIFFDGVSLLPTIKGKDLNLPAYSETSPVQLFTGDLSANKEFEDVEMMSLRKNSKKYIFKNKIYELATKQNISNQYW
jgi:choline-sulfatase